MRPHLIPDNSQARLGASVLAELRRAFPTQWQSLAWSWVICDRGSVCRSFHYRSDVLFYPASLVKVFYLVAAHAWLEAGRLSENDAELHRALHDAIVVSSNDATSLLVDLLSGTTSGPCLPAETFARWQQQRQAVNRYFQGWGCPEFARMNASQKTWSDDYYGRERAFVGPNYEHRNRLSTAAVARLLLAIARQEAVTPARSQAMLALLARSPRLPLKPGAEENQVDGFLGAGLPPDARLYSKAGWTSWVRHDAAYIQLPAAVAPYILVACSERERGTPPVRELLPFLSACIADIWLKTTANGNGKADDSR